MKLSQIINSFDKKSAFLLGMIYAWPMISKDKNYILAYSSYKMGKRSSKLGDIDKYYILHKKKLLDFLGNEFEIKLNNEIKYKFDRNKGQGVSVVFEYDIENNIYGVIEKYLIDLDDELKKWFLIGFMDGRGSLDFTGHFFTIDIAQRDNPEIAKRKLNKMFDIVGLTFNYNPRLLQKKSHQKNDQFRLNLEYFAGHYGFFRPFLIDYYQLEKGYNLVIDDRFLFIDENYKTKQISQIAKNFEINEFAISLKGLSKEEKLKKAQEYRIQNFDFDSEDEIIYSSANTKEEAKKLANYKCEFDSNHTTFISKSTNNFYVEAHHLIPFSKRNEFDVSIDIVQNLVALCPNCHRKIHLAKDEEKKLLLDTLFENRKENLLTENINIDKKKLYNFYNIKG